MKAARFVGALAAALWVAAGAGEVAGAADGGLDPSALLVPQDAPELERLPALRARLLTGPHAYFRFVNARFAALVCERQAQLVAGQPAVTLHGDPHLEQYAVTERGRGLTDFDDASLGPAVLDLARFATSIRLALRERSWDGAEALVSRFLEGYAAALRQPRTEAPVPAVARRLAAGFEHNRIACMARAEALMRDLPAARAPSPATLGRVAMLLADAAGKPLSFFAVKKVGALTIGIGSAADEKYLLRVEGPSPSPNDDVILELKEVRTLPALACIRSEQGPTRILVGQSRLAYEPFQYVGALNLEGRYFWFHAWPDNYAELDIRRTLDSPAELSEVAYDVGVQLGRGHPKGLKGGSAQRLRKTLLDALRGSQIQALSAGLADASEAAWRLFCERAGHAGPGAGGRP